MKRYWKMMGYVAIFAALFMMSSCSDSSTDPDDGPNGDTTDPTVVVNLVANQNISGIQNIRITATDDTDLYSITLMIDGVTVESKTDVIFEGDFLFEVNSMDYSEGLHSVTARAVDEAGNITTSSPISVNMLFDFDPENNGLIRVSVDQYQELDPLDLTGYGDPYFVFKLYIDDVLFEEYQSAVTWDTYYINTPIYHDFDIDDSTKQIKVAIIVYDKDDTSDDVVDYCPESGVYYTWTMNTMPNGIPLNYSNTYSGANDGMGDDDCQITMSVKVM